MAKTARDVEKGYPLKDVVAKLRRLADSIESGKRFAIQVHGERIYVPPAPSTTSSTSAGKAWRKSNSRSGGRRSSTASGGWAERSAARAFPPPSRRVGCASLYPP
jgi:hypothetical protein